MSKKNDNSIMVKIGAAVVVATGGSVAAVGVATVLIGAGSAIAIGLVGYGAYKYLSKGKNEKDDAGS